MKHNWQLLEELGIDLHRKQSGSIKTQCPKCSLTRRNKKDTCLSVDIDAGTYNCHHCEDFHGKVFHKFKQEYIKPPSRLEKMDIEAIDYFENHRKISNNTLLRFKITSASEWMPKAQSEIRVICFNYFRKDELINVKFRGKSKDFKMVKDAELIFYNLDSIKDEKEVIICEGEIDALSIYEAGFPNVVSVPNGASKGSQKLEYLDNCWKDFDNKEKIILMTDGDEAGIALRDELMRRLGRDRCWVVHYPENCKDANEVLIKHGKDELKKIIGKADQSPLEGIVPMDEMYETIVDFYEHGYPKGVAAGVGKFDELLTFYPGQLTIFTGAPGSGKSEFVDWLMASISKNHGWNWGICSFENPPVFHATKLAEKLTGRAFDFRVDPSNRISSRQLEYAIQMIDKHFTFVNLSMINVTMDGLIEKATELVKRKGIKGFLFDPWNCIEPKVPHGQAPTDYILECLNKLINFLEQYQVHGFLVAHPIKLKKEMESKKMEVPNLYSISGSAHFFNRTHNGVSLHRDFITNIVDIYVQKVKYSWLGKVDFCSYRFNTMTREYLPI